MPTKMRAVLALGALVVTATPALAGGNAALGLDDPDPFLTEASFAPLDTSGELPGAYEMVSFQDSGLGGFNEVNVNRAGLPRPIGDVPNRVTEPMSMAMFASGMLALVMTRRRRRKL